MSGSSGRTGAQLGAEPQGGEPDIWLHFASFSRPPPPRLARHLAGGSCWVGGGGSSSRLHLGPLVAGESGSAFFNAQRRRTASATWHLAPDAREPTGAKSETVAGRADEVGARIWLHFRPQWTVRAGRRPPERERERERGARRLLARRVPMPRSGRQRVIIIIIFPPAARRPRRLAMTMKDCSL